jgi:two-component system response regulator TrcR
MALQYEGWEIDVARDAREAVEKYRENTPDSWS